MYYGAPSSAMIGGRNGKAEESFEVQAPHPPARMKPLAEKASDGRANPKGIPCLYLATKQETAVLEVRPLIGSYVSVAQFKVLKDLRLVDCSAKEMSDLVRFLKKDWTPEETEKQVWSDINTAFSEPVERGDDSLDYIPTQIITETFKLNGFDGIAYKSSYGEDGFNVALFDVAAADVINCGLYRIKDVSVTLSEQDNPYFISKHYPTAPQLLRPPPRIQTPPRKEWSCLHRSIPALGQAFDFSTGRPGSGQAEIHP